MVITMVSKELDSGKWEEGELVLFFVMCSSRKYPYTPTVGIGISWGMGVSVGPKNLKKCIKLNWNSQSSGWVFKKIHSMGKVWIFSEITQ